MQTNTMNVTRFRGFNSGTILTASLAFIVLAFVPGAVVAIVLIAFTAAFVAGAMLTVSIHRMIPPDACANAGRGELWSDETNGVHND